MFLKPSMDFITWKVTIRHISHPADALRELLRDVLIINIYTFISELFVCKCECSVNFP